MIFPEKYFSCYILLTDEHITLTFLLTILSTCYILISLTDCLYFLKNWAIWVSHSGGGGGGGEGGVMGGTSHPKIFFESPPSKPMPPHSPPLPHLTMKPPMEK